MNDDTLKLDPSNNDDAQPVVEEGASEALDDLDSRFAELEQELETAKQDSR